MSRPPHNLYLAGPMRGIPRFNFPLFHEVTAKLREEGWNVFSPAERDNKRYGVDISVGNEKGCEAQAATEHGFDMREALGADLGWLVTQADSICMLPGWEKSKGATAEYATAEALGLKIFYWPDPLLYPCLDQPSFSDPCMPSFSDPVAVLPADNAERKGFPLASGCFDYFPDALLAVAQVSQACNEQHNKGQPLHWARSKSSDEADAMLRHFADRGTLDSDGQRHSAKMAWRALALLQKELEFAFHMPISRGSKP